MKSTVFGILAISIASVSPLTADMQSSGEIVVEEIAVDYDPNEQLQEFFNALPNELKLRISEYREKSLVVAEEVAEYNERPRNGLPPSSFKTAQRKRMKIEAQMASLRLEQKAIAKEYYDLLSTGWEPPNNSNIIRLLVTQTGNNPATS
ncbi:hypothetical protein [Cerasicoccus frondis]|uniref:hypothetical protein n=1 Tax=Cerasicoccus frondis TaxID=490090 RepID=UPI0028529375|nr:hypothetical protein [Cerasicoccus frondis]